MARADLSAMLSRLPEDEPSVPETPVAALPTRASIRSRATSVGEAGSFHTMAADATGAVLRTLLVSGPDAPRA